MHASYIKDKKSITHLAKDAKTGISSVRRALKGVQIIEPAKSEWIKEILLMIDTTYWGRNFGVTFFKDAISKKFIWWHFINRKEKKNKDYKLGLKWCLEHGCIIKGVVSDGFRGLTKLIASVPFQICQVHI